MDTAATALVQAAPTLLAEGDQAAAQARLREAVKFKSRAPRAHRMLGGLLLLADDRDHDLLINSTAARLDMSGSFVGNCMDGNR
jgi:hypothetical protein